MNKKVVNAVLSSSVLDFPVQLGGKPTRLTVALLVEPMTRRILSYAIAPVGRNRKALASVLKKGVKALRTHSKKSGRLKLESIFLDVSSELRSRKIRSIAVKQVSK